MGQQADIRILDPANINTEEAIGSLQQLAADLFVVCDYGQILSRQCLAAARLGGINLHGSLLPKYRGAAPINWAIYHGETTTGVSVIHMSAKLDAGPCLAQAEYQIQPEQTAAEVEPELAELGVPPVLHAIELLQDWDGNRPIGQRQDPALATKAPRLKKSDGLIDWQSRTAKQIVDQIRAFQPWPGTFTNWQPPNGKQPIRIIVHRAEAVDVLSTDVQPGQVCESGKTRLVIATANGGLSLKSIQPAGKKRMDIEAFLRGHQVQVGDTFNQ